MIDDKQFSRILKKELPEAPSSPWFTRKVINRLPARSTATLERVAYLLGTVGVLCYVAWAVRTITISPQNFTVSVLCGLVASTVIIVSMACSIVRAKLSV